MVKKVIWILVIVCTAVSGKVLSATYEVSFGVFEALGTADTRFEIRDDGTYSVRIEARTSGIAKILTNNRVEIYESNGIVRNGILIPLKYSKIRRTDSKRSFKIYTFDHENKVVWKETIDKDDWAKVKNDFYASDDILSLFFNFKHYIQPRESRIFHAIGGSKQEGRVDVVYPEDREVKEMAKKLQMQSGEFLKVILNDRIFASANGELLINLGQDGLCDKAVLEDVLLFGDIVGKRIR